jgi:DNA adenine methylase
MAYLGSKAKNSDHILKVLNHTRFDGMDYVEPFVGYGHILRRINNKSSYTASDSNPLLITLLKAIQKREKIPTITKDEYDTLKHKTNDSLKRATAAFTYSYCGKQFSGYVDKYVRDGKRLSYAEERKRYYKSLQNNDIFMRTRFSCMDYRKIKCVNTLIYCDPPYADTTAYHGAKFDSNEFWRHMRELSKQNYVFISEYKAPSDFKCITTNVKQCSLPHQSRSVRKEKLFVHNTTWAKMKTKQK